MAPNNFVFPPPPPPPSQTSYQNCPTYPSNQSRDFSNDSHASYGSYRGRGQANEPRGSSLPRGGINQRQSYGYHGPRQQSVRGAYSSHHTVSNSPNYGSRPSQFDAFNGGFKRERPTAPRAPAAPAVPRFGLPLPSKPIAAVDTLPPIKKRKREHNQLGLTPKQEDHESSEEDVEEEERLARSLGVAGKGPLGLQFTYNGRSSTLNSASELAAWLAERRKRYPTRARAEEEEKRSIKQREEAQQAKQIEEERRRKEKEQQTIQLARLKVEESIKRKQQSKVDEDLETDREAKAIRKAEKLRKKYEKAQERVARIAARHASPSNPLNDSAEHELVPPKVETVDDVTVAGHAAEALDSGALLTPTSQSLSPVTVPKNLVFNSLDGKDGPKNTTDSKEDVIIKKQDDSSSVKLESLDSDTSSSGSDSEYSSSSSSSDDETSDSDAAPKIVSSKTPASIPAETPKPPPPKKLKDEICRSYLRNGRCPHIDRCLYKHELPERGALQREKKRQQLKEEKPLRAKPTVPRISLYQRMVLQEQEQEEQNILDHIISLGEQGLLEDDGKK